MFASSSRLATRLRLAGSAAGLLLALAAAAPRTAHAQIDPMDEHSSSVGVVDGQYARLNVFFTAAADNALPPGPCRVTLRFLDATGVTLSESVVSLEPGRAAQLDYRPSGLRVGARATVRTQIIGERDANGVAPLLIPSLEIIDVATGKTSVTDPGSIRGFNPQPDPPGDVGDVGIFGLAGGQVAHVTASYVGITSDTGFPPGPCTVALTLFSGDGAVIVSRRVSVAPGATVALDFAAGSLPAGVRRRMYAHVATDRRQQGFVTESVEIVDADTGRSAALLPSSFVQSWGWE